MQLDTIIKNFSELRENIDYFIGSGYFSSAESEMLKTRLDRTEKSLIKLKDGYAKDKCPLGGDTSDDCRDCAYSGDYHYDKNSGTCIKRLA